MYCSACQPFVEGISKAVAAETVASDEVQWVPFTATDYKSIKELEVGSQAGCAICRNVRYTWADREWTALQGDSRVIVELALDNKMPLLKASITPRSSGRTSQSRMIGMYLREADTGLSRILTSSSSPENASTGSAASFAMAQYWKEECIQKHIKCPKPVPYLPSRVIDVGPADGSEDPRLYEESISTTPVPNDRKRYAALSHCWGPPPWFRTTEETLTARRAGMKISELPPTFRDAVIVTRRMGLRYLWIDSICIIQGNADDWKKEAVKMCDYYSNALFTITSARSENSHGGLFAERDGIRILPFVIDIDLPHKVVHAQFSPMPRREIVYDAAELQLYKRAWVLQEMILSRRALIYDPDIVRWECLTSYGSERAPDGGIVRHHVVVREVQNAIAQTDGKTDTWDILGKDIPMRSSMWQHIVQDFMERALTQKTDRLIAIAGVAQAIQRHTSDTYIAGLWKKFLPYGLGWFVRHAMEQSVVASNGTNVGFVVEPPPYRSKSPVAPSWSFASVNVTVRFMSALQDRPLCTVVDATVSGPPDCQTGTLTISGDTRQVYVMGDKKSVLAEFLKLSKDKHYKYTEDFGLMQWLLRPESMILISSDDPSKWRRQVQAIQGHWYPDEMIDPEKPVTFLAITQHPRLESMPSGTRAQVVHTLALIETGLTPNEYRRVGYAAWEDCAWYGYDCCEYRAAKREPYRRLRKSWGSIKPPQLAENGTPRHPVENHSVFHDPLPALDAYHSLADVKRRTITIV